MPTKLLLTPDQATRTAFPPGCPVLYGFRRYSPPNKNGGTTWEANEGVVQSVALDTERRRFELRVAPQGTGKGRAECANGVDPLADGALELALEGDVAYAVRCPVAVAALDAAASPAGWCPALAFPGACAFPDLCGVTATAAAECAPEADEATGGRVLCVRPAFDEKTGAVVSVRYVVEQAVGQGRWRTEEGVAPGRLSYANADGVPSFTLEVAVRDVGDTGRERADGEIGTSDGTQEERIPEQEILFA